MRIFAPAIERKLISGKLAKRPRNRLGGQGSIEYRACGRQGASDYGDMEENSKSEFFVYVLRSIEHERNYVGFTTNVENRLFQHNSGKTKSTKGYVPWRLLFTESYKTKEEALQREKYLKSGIGRDYIKSKLNELK